MVPRKLPPELEEEILIRVPHQYLVRFRCVCKEWNTLFKGKRFMNKLLVCARQKFMFNVRSRSYSMSVNLNEDPSVKVRDLTSDFPGGELVICDGQFFSFDMGDVGAAIWNPALRQTRRIPAIAKQYICQRFIMFQVETNAWRFIDHVHVLESLESLQGGCNVYLNGNLYWTAYNGKTSVYTIQILDVLEEIVKPFCILPCRMDNIYRLPLLTVYKTDRFSLLEQCVKTSKTDIWVTKKKISNGDDGDAVVWIKFMTVCIPKLPLFNHISSSYFIEDSIFGKSFVICCGEGKVWQACVYIVMGDMCKKIEIDVVGMLRWSYTYVPSLTPITLDEENKKNSQV